MKALSVECWVGLMLTEMMQLVRETAPLELGQDTNRLCTVQAAGADMESIDLATLIIHSDN